MEATLSPHLHQDVRDAAARLSGTQFTSWQVAEMTASPKPAVQDALDDLTLIGELTSWRYNCEEQTTDKIWARRARAAGLTWGLMIYAVAQ